MDPAVAARRYPVQLGRFLDKLKTRCTAHTALPVNQSQAVRDKKHIVQVSFGYLYLLDHSDKP